MRQANIKVFVRRGGPNYQIGLQKMKDLSVETKIPFEVYLSPYLVPVYLFFISFYNFLFIFFYFFYFLFFFIYFYLFFLFFIFFLEHNQT